MPLREERKPSHKQSSTYCHNQRDHSLLETDNRKNKVRKKKSQLSKEKKWTASRLDEHSPENMFACLTTIPTQHMTPSVTQHTLLLSNLNTGPDCDFRGSEATSLALWHSLDMLAAVSMECNANIFLKMALQTQVQSQHDIHSLCCHPLTWGI